MSTAVLVAADSKTSAPHLRVATLDDYDGVVALEAAAGMESMDRDDWRNLWLDNPVWPRVRRDWPIGWVLETDAGRIVGSVFNIPSLYLFQRRELISANGRGWVVDPAYRAFALSLMAEYFGRTDVDLFVNTTVGLNAVATNAMFSSAIPAGDFERVAYFATSYRRPAAKGLRRKGVPLANFLACPAAAVLRLLDAFRLRKLPHSPADVTVERIEQFDDRFDAFWNELVRQKPDVLLAVRDRATLAWHFAAPLRRGDLRIFTASSHGRLRGYCILKRQDPTGELTRMRLVDFQTLDAPAALFPGLLRAALRSCRGEDIDILEHLGVGLPKLAQFEAFAPYRREQPCKPFFYRAVDEALDAQLADPRHWEPSVYDGDSSYN